MRPRSAGALQRIIEDYFDVQVEIEQFTGAWYRLRPRTCACSTAPPANPNNWAAGPSSATRFGISSRACACKRDRSGWTKYLDFLPSGTAYEPLRSLAKFVSRGEIDFEIRLILKKDEVPACELGRRPAAPRLGWTSWAKTQAQAQHANDTILPSEEEIYI